MQKEDRKKIFKIHGKVIEKGTGEGIPNLTVKAFDKDLFFDDPLGAVITDRNGHFEIRYSGKEFKEFIFDRKPDLFLRVFDPQGRIIYSSRDWVRREASEKEGFLIKIPGKKYTKPKEKVIEKPVEKPKEALKKKVKKKKKEVKGIPLEKLSGVGPGRAKKLRSAGIKDVNAFSKADEKKLKKILGNLDVKKMKREADKILKKKK